jgi:hypothetical protein
MATAVLEETRDLIGPRPCWRKSEGSRPSWNRLSLETVVSPCADRLCPSGRIHLVARSLVHLCNQDRDEVALSSRMNGACHPPPCDRPAAPGEGHSAWHWHPGPRALAA